MLYQHKSIQTFLKDLSSDRPIPGGGAVGALSAALAISLGLMVARLALKRKSLQSKGKAIQSVIQRLNRLNAKCLQIFEKDPLCYQAVCKTWKTPAQDRALFKAYEIQKNLVEICFQAQREIELLKKWVKGSLAEDLKVSTATLSAAALSARVMAQINIQYLNNLKLKKRLSVSLKKLEKKS